MTSIDWKFTAGQGIFYSQGKVAANKVFCEPIGHTNQEISIHTLMCTHNQEGYRVYLLLESTLIPDWLHRLAVSVQWRAKVGPVQDERGKWSQDPFRENAPHHPSADHSALYQFCLRRSTSFNASLKDSGLDFTICKYNYGDPHEILYKQDSWVFISEWRCIRAQSFCTRTHYTIRDV